MNLRRYIPKFLKYPLIIIYVFFRCVTRGIPDKKLALNLAGVLPNADSDKIIHGGKVKLLHLREHFGDTWRKFNIAYFVSSGLPFAPAIWIKIYKFFGVKIVWNQNGVAYPALYTPEIVKRINDLYKDIHLCDYVVYQTEFCKRTADKFAAPFNGPSEILINPIDTERFSPRQDHPRDTAFRIIMSGHHFESEERMRVSIEAIREMRKRGIETKLLVIGQTTNLPKEDWIEYLGAYTQDEAPSLYRRADLLLHLKYMDPCPTIVLEALACGLPVVALKSGGIPEMVEPESSILIEVPEDYRELHYPKSADVAEAMIEVRNNLTEFSRNARIQALKFDKEIWLKKHEEIFKKL